MGEIMQFPETVEEFMQQYKITDTQQVYTSGTELVPIFRMEQWFEAHNAIDRVPAVDAVPVIRCRECKFWEPYGGKGTRNAEGPLEWEGGCMKWRGRHLESDFCSYGEKVKNNA